MADVYFGNPNIARQGQKARALAAGRSVEGLPDPRTYGFVSGLLSGDPNVGVSALSPSAGPMKEAAYAGAQLSNALMMAPAVRGAGLLANEGMMALGRAGERLAERVVPEVMARGGLPAQLMTDLAQGSQSKIWIGQNAKNWDAVSNKVAKELDAAGVDAREIWSRTGNWKAPDGKWRQEISDRGAELRTTFDASMASKANNYVGGLEGPIGGMLRHEELYKAYPELLRTDRMSVTKLPEWLPESANSGVYKRTYGGKGALEIRNKTEEGALNTAVHELQHGVQNIEKFQGGGMEGQFKDIPGGKSAFEQYRALQGEAEARAAAARQMLTNEQRRALFPEDSYDMPISGLLSR